MIQFTVYGNPAPQGSKRAFRLKTGRIALVESSKKVKPWRQDVKFAAIEAKEKNGIIAPLDCPVSVSVVFYLARPKSAKKRIWPDRTPDVDKLARCVLDSIVESGILVDDARVVLLSAMKRYAGTEEPMASPGATINICNSLYY